MWFQFDICQIGIGDFDSLGIGFCIHRRLDQQALTRRRVADQAHHSDQIVKRFASPVLCDKRKQPMFDFIPLTCAWWKMTNRDVPSHETRQFLQFRFPQTPSITMTSTGIRRNQQSCYIGEAITSHPSPPSPNTVCRKLSPPLTSNTDD